MFLHQGDIQVAKIERLPDGVQQADPFVVRSEVSGNVHFFAAECGEYFKDNAGNTYVNLPKGGVLVHTHETLLNTIVEERLAPEELAQQIVEKGLYRDHLPIVMSPGIYLLGRHTMYDPASGLQRQVID
ncbi:MAG: hypothetical protein KatS3mg054_0027 [Chloroflexus sp.]|nr:MAG: hypothetical protein KatS3mg054_0027 [Chloroflexus sp.]